MQRRTLPKERKPRGMSALLARENTHRKNGEEQYHPSTTALDRQDAVHSEPGGDRSESIYEKRKTPTCQAAVVN